MKPIFKHLRLLPAVVIVGFGVLMLKGVDIARAAQGAVDDASATLAPSDPVSGSSHPDYANGEDPSDSASEVDVLTSLTRRRAELDARERGLNMRENLLNASEGRVSQKIAALQSLQTQIQGLLKQRDTAQQDQINSLIKSYGPDGMKPAQAAAIFNTMPDEVLVPIAKGMKPADLGPILAKMNPEAAQKLTVKLAALLKLPETATTAACPTTASLSPVPGTVADGTALNNPPVTLDTPPQQTAAATPPPAVTPPPAPAPAPVIPPPATLPAAAPAKPQPAAATTPPAATPPAKPATTTPLPPAPAKPQTTAAAPPPHHAPPHHVARATPPPKPTNPPVTLDKPAPGQAAAPPKPATATPPAPATPAPTQAAVTPPKPSVPAPIQAAATTPPAATTPAPAVSPPPAAASTAPTPLTH